MDGLEAAEPTCATYKDIRHMTLICVDKTLNGLPIVSHAATLKEPEQRFVSRGMSVSIKLSLFVSY